MKRREMLARLGLGAVAAFARPLRASAVRTDPPAQQLALGRVLRDWGLDRLMWGTDALTDRLANSLEQARKAWPLTEAEWGTLAALDGTGFRPRIGT